jgi:hypothetical protein
MVANGKVQITITGSEGAALFGPDGTLGPGSQVVIADTVVHTFDRSNLSVLELRIVVPANRAEELLLGMLRGDTELVIGPMSEVKNPD